MEKPQFEKVKAKTFEELLVEEAGTQRYSMVNSLIKAFQENDPTAIKYVTQVLISNKYNEENKFPLTEQRFEEIICYAADRIRGII